MSVLYFEFNATEQAVAIYSEREQRHGGMLPPHQGTHGIAFEAFKEAGAGKIKQVEGGSYIIRPARRILSLVAPK